MNGSMRRGGASRRAIGAVASALAFVLALFAPQTALAEESGTGTTDSTVATYALNDNAKITKNINASQLIETVSKTFTFKVEATNDGEGVTADQAKAVLTSAGKSTTTVTAAAMGDSWTQKLEVPITNLIPSDANSYTAPGVYYFTITEEAGAAGDGVSYSQAKYLVRVSMHALGTIDGITVQKLADDAGTNLAGQNQAVKVDPTAGGLEFTNTFTATGDLTVNKTITGDFSDTTKQFSVTVNLEFPSWVENGKTYNVTKPDGTTSTVTVGTGADGKKTAQMPVELTNGQNVTLSGRPVGTKYSVVDSGAEGYVTSKTSTEGTETKSGNAVTVTGVVQPNGSQVTVNSSAQTVSVTGIVIEKVPYLLLICIPVVAFVAWFVIRRRADLD